METGNNLRHDLKEAITTVLREKLKNKGNAEIDALVCISLKATGEEFTVKIHERIENEFSDEVSACNGSNSEVLDTPVENNVSSACHGSNSAVVVARVEGDVSLEDTLSKSTSETLPIKDAQEKEGDDDNMSDTTIVSHASVRETPEVKSPDDDDIREELGEEEKSAADGEEQQDMFGHNFDLSEEFDEINDLEEQFEATSSAMDQFAGEETTSAVDQLGGEATTSALQQFTSETNTSPEEHFVGESKTLPEEQFTGEVTTPTTDQFAGEAKTSSEEFSSEAKALAEEQLAGEVTSIEDQFANKPMSTVKHFADNLATENIQFDHAAEPVEGQFDDLSEESQADEGEASNAKAGSVEGPNVVVKDAEVPDHTTETDGIKIVECKSLRFGSSEDTRGVTKVSNTDETQRTTKDLSVQEPVDIERVIKITECVESLNDKPQNESLWRKHAESEFLNTLEMNKAPSAQEDIAKSVSGNTVKNVEPGISASPEETAMVHQTSPDSDVVLIDDDDVDDTVADNVAQSYEPGETPGPAEAAEEEEEEPEILLTCVKPAPQPPRCSPARPNPSGGVLVPNAGQPRSNVGYNASNLSRNNVGRSYPVAQGTFNRSTYSNGSQMGSVSSQLSSADSSTYTCGICSTRFDVYAHLSRHLETAHQFNVFLSCTLCREYFPNQQTFKIHRDLKHPDKRFFICPHCSSGFGVEECQFHRQECRPTNGNPGSSSSQISTAFQAPSLPRQTQQPLGRNQPMVYPSTGRGRPASAPNTASSPRVPQYSAATSTGRGTSSLKRYSPAIPHQSPSKVPRFSSAPARSVPPVSAVPTDAPPQSQSAPPRRRMDRSSHYICDQCNTTQPTLRDYERHCLNMHNRFVCPICSTSFPSRKGADRHMQLHL